MLFSASLTYAGGGPVEFTVDPDTSLYPGKVYIVHARVYTDGPYPSYCQNCLIHLKLKNPQDSDVINQSSERTDDEGMVYAKVISTVPGKRVIYPADLETADGNPITSNNYVELNYIGESAFLETPTNVRISQIETTQDPDHRNVHIMWDPVPGAASYNIYINAGTADEYTVTVDTNLYEMDVNTSSVFDIVVSAVNGNLESDRSQTLIIDLSSTPVLDPAAPLVNTVTVAPCGSSSCGSITTVIIDGGNFEDTIKVAAVGLTHGEQYGQDTFSSPDVPYAVIVGKTGNNQLIVDFHGLPCNQLYKIQLYYPAPDSRYATTQTDSFAPHNACLNPKG